MDSFGDINVSQGSVATYARYGGIFNIYLTTNLRRNLPVKFFNRLRFDRIMVMSQWTHFFYTYAPRREDVDGLSASTTVPQLHQISGRYVRRHATIAVLVDAARETRPECR